MKNYIIILFSLTVVSGYGQKIGNSYYSFPDRNIEFQYNDSCIIWVDHFPRIGSENRIILKIESIRKEDTTYISKINNNSWLKIYKIIKKGKYLDVYYTESCGVVFQRNSIPFQIQSKNLNSRTNRENRILMFDLIQRIKRLEIFNKSCDTKLPLIEEPL